MASNNIQQLTTAGEPGDAHIPYALNDPSLLITSGNTTVETMPTIFVGIVDNAYPEDHWQDHSALIKSLFGITDTNLVGEIKVNNRGNNTIDGQQLALSMRNAVKCINNQHFDKIRIVHMGIGSSMGVDLDVAIESLIRGWSLSSDRKYIQFVALGDTPDHHYMNFCKMLCLKRLCNTVQYYNTMDYNDFGYVDLNLPLIRHLGRFSGLGRRGNSTSENPNGTLHYQTIKLYRENS